MSSDACAVVLGGATAGCSIIHELHAHGVGPIVLLDKRARTGSLSRRIAEFQLVAPESGALRDALLGIHARYGRCVLFPTFDEHLEQLVEVHDELAHACHLPFNPENLTASLSKITQYEACERLGVAYPRTTYLHGVQDLEGLSEIPFPFLLKPQEKTREVIQPRLVESAADLTTHRPIVEKHLSQGISYLASEFVPGDGSNIHAYVGLRTADGRILNEWIGKKLSQYPHEFGVFASASNQCPEEVRVLGRKLIDGMDLHGIVEPEFKYDSRDGSFKLMEINLRSMGWVHVGHLSGVPLHYCQFLHATGQDVPHFEQDQARDIRLIQLQSEVSNLLHREHYGPIFRSVLGHGDRRVIAMCDPRDPRPAFSVLTGTAVIVAKWLRDRLRGSRSGGPARPEAA